MVTAFAATSLEGTLASPPTAASQLAGDDDAALVQLFDNLCSAGGSGDARRYAELFTPSSTYVSFDGTIAHGRDAMAANHDILFRGVLAGSTLVGTVESIGYLGADVAVMHATGSVLMPWRTRLPRRRLSRQTIVAVRTDEGWRIAALHNGRVSSRETSRPRLNAVQGLPRTGTCRACTRRRLEGEAGSDTLAVIGRDVSALYGYAGPS